MIFSAFLIFFIYFLCYNTHSDSGDIPVFRNYHYISLELMSKFTIKNNDFLSVFDFFYLFFML